MLPNVKTSSLIALTKQKLNEKWTTSRNASIVSNEKMSSNELLLLRRYFNFERKSFFCSFSNSTMFSPKKFRKSKMQNWRKGEKKKRLLDHTILCLMWRKMKVCQERRSESWKRISCRYQVRRIISVSWCLELWARYSCKEIYRYDHCWFFCFDCTREIRIGLVLS
jgi:hypothetical protein